MYLSLEHPTLLASLTLTASPDPSQAPKDLELLSWSSDSGMFERLASLRFEIPKANAASVFDLSERAPVAVSWLKLVVVSNYNSGGDPLVALGGVALMGAPRPRDGVWATAKSVELGQGERVWFFQKRYFLL